MMLGLLSSDSAKQMLSKVTTKTHYVASCVRNIYAKNY